MFSSSAWKLAWNASTWVLLAADSMLANPNLTLTFDLWPFNFQTMSLLGYPTVIPYPSLNTLGSFVFWVMLGTNKQTNKQTDKQKASNVLSTPTDIVGVGNHDVCQGRTQCNIPASSRFVIRHMAGPKEPQLCCFRKADDKTFPCQHVHSTSMIGHIHCWAHDVFGKLTQRRLLSHTRTFCLKLKLLLRRFISTKIKRYISSLLTPTLSIGVGRIFESVCLSIYPQHN